LGFRGEWRDGGDLGFCRWEALYWMRVEFCRVSFWQVGSFVGWRGGVGSSSFGWSWGLVDVLGSLVAGGALRMDMVLCWLCELS